ncbi:serine/arginine repetitive matrix protein 1 [Melia azedarach]|uniref:Serine/arginine repetitive matrix protein 1 n=1 Tax=Melia azedarach TaxID=155640 RepID=A0ACC1YPK6_MELAZ|nr:serine/arginine repetitive matrix protein 1 [Melia azedarach]
MSGGFFRGTSADQDTRFSNKQAKLLKTQKFAPELDHLVDMTKVKMDVMRPWIANRVTELLGFEDEVLINFIYGLLDGKEVNGKEVQISLTGFMEKNTAKFMKELWMLLLSAQRNASGVPQQFLDAKEEETRKKKLEAERIANEIQKKKERENRELDQERSRNMDGAVEMKVVNADLDPNSKTMLAKDSSAYPKNEKEVGERNGVRGRHRVSRSPHPAARSPSSRRGSPLRSISKSQSNSRSYSDEKRKSRSVSRSPKARRRSISPRRRSITPRGRYSPRISHSPPSRRSSYFRRRSRSLSSRRSPSPLQRKLRSPFRRKSPSPLRRRSPSPIRRRRSPSPIRRRRSPSPIRRRRSPSPVRRRRSPSPVRRRRSPSPVRRRRSPSPVRRRRLPSPVRQRRSPSPIRRRRSPSPVRRHRSPSPICRRRSPLSIRRSSPSPLGRRSPSPAPCWSSSPVRRISPSLVRRRYRRSPLTSQHRSPSPAGDSSPLPSRMRSATPSQRRSPSPCDSRSPSPARRRIPSPVRRRSPNDGRRLPVHSPREKNRTLEKLSPAARRPSSFLKSPQQDSKDRKDLPKRDSAFSPSLERSPTVSESPPQLTRKRSTSEDRRSFSPDGSPVRQTRERIARDGSISPSPRPRERRLRQGGPETSMEDKETCHAREDGDLKSVESHGRSLRSSMVGKQKDSPRRVRNKEDPLPGSEKLSARGFHPETSDQQSSPTIYEDPLPGGRRRSTYSGGSQKSERNHSHKSNGKDNDRHCKSENTNMEVEKVDQSNRSDASDSVSEQSEKPKAKSKEKRKHKKYDKEEGASDDDYSYDSEIEKKEAKRRKKEEKKLRKEEKRRRRDERRRRREERRAEKLKLKNQSDADASDGKHVTRREYYPSDDGEAESEQKRLEIELRNKALESIKAKKNSSR